MTAWKVLGGSHSQAACFAGSQSAPRVVSYFGSERRGWILCGRTALLPLSGPRCGSGGHVLFSSQGPAYGHDPVGTYGQAVRGAAIRSRREQSGDPEVQTGSPAATGSAAGGRCGSAAAGATGPGHCRSRPRRATARKRTLRGQPIHVGYGRKKNVSKADERSFCQ